MNDVKLTARITKRNNILLELMEQNNIYSVAELSRQSGLTIPQISVVLYLKLTSIKSERLQKLASFFKVTPEYLLPETLIEFSKKSKGIKTFAERDMNSMDLLMQMDQKRLESNPEYQANFSLMKESIAKKLDKLTERENLVLRLRFGLDDGRPRTYEEVGKVYEVTRERIRQIEAKALRKLRHPNHANELLDQYKEHLLLKDK